MADKKISELTAITGSNTAATDVFVVVDTSTGQTKKITREELNNAIEQDVLSSIDIDTINGDFSVNGNINLGDNNKAIFGAGSDLQIYHTGSDSVIADGGTGNLNILGDADVAIINAASTEYKARFITDGAVELYHNGTQKFATTSTGVDVTGALTVSGDFTVNGTTTTINSTTLEVDDKNIVLASGAADAAAANGSGITIDGASATFTYVSSGDKWQLNKPLDVGGDVTFGDDEKAIFGAGSDLRILHDGTHSKIQDVGTGDLKIQATNLLLEAQDGTNYIYAVDGTAVRLYHPDATNGIKLATTSTGVDITGNATFDDNGKAIFGAGTDLQIYHDGSNTAIQNATGELFVYGGGDQIRIRAENGEESIVANPNGSVDLYHNGSAKISTTNQGIDVTGLIATDGLTSSDLITTTAMSVNHSNGAKFRQYSMNAVAGGGAWLLGKIEHGSSNDGGVSGKLCFAHDYGSTTDSPNIHFTFQQRSGVARGHWWYENTDDDAASDNVSVKLIDDGSGGMFVWVVADDYVNCSVEASWRQVSESYLSDSGTLSAGTITTGTTLFDTANDPTAEMHIGKLFAHDSVLIGTDSGDGFNADATLRLQKASGNNYVQIKTASSSQGGILIGDADDDFVGGMIYNNSSNYLRFDSNNAEKMRLEGDGDLHVDGNVVAYSTTVSDIRLKKDIAPIEDAVTKVQQLNGCTFTYLKDGRQSAGLLAQDLEKVLPSAVIEDEAVFHGEEGETYKTVQYDQVIGLLVEAVKELKAEIEELKNGTAE
jgi:hypothetical protein